MLVTIENLIDYMSDITLLEGQRRSAELVLSGIQSDLENYLHRPLEQVRVREKVATNAIGEAITRYSPVQRILSVKPINSDVVIPVVIVPETLTDISAFTDENIKTIDLQPAQNNIVAGGIYIGIPRAWFIIEYLAGGQDIASPVIDSIKLAILRVAAREMTGNHDDTLGLKAGFVAEPEESEPLVRGWKPEELKSFDTLRRRIVR